jgi:hypothetical protein
VEIGRSLGKVSSQIPSVVVAASRRGAFIALGGLPSLLRSPLQTLRGVAKERRDLLPLHHHSGRLRHTGQTGITSRPHRPLIPRRHREENKCSILCDRRPGDKEGHRKNKNSLLHVHHRPRDDAPSGSLDPPMVTPGASSANNLGASKEKHHLLIEPRMKFTSCSKNFLPLLRRLTKRKQFKSCFRESLITPPRLRTKSHMKKHWSRTTSPTTQWIRDEADSDSHQHHPGSFYEAFNKKEIHKKMLEAIAGKTVGSDDKDTVQAG